MKKIFFYLGIMLLAVCFAACNNNNPEEHNGELTGVFSVSKSQQVIFSQGNLQYLPTDKIWEFSTSETNAKGADNNKVYTDPAKWMDLFAWGAKDPLRQDLVEEDFVTFYDWGNNKIQNGGNKAKTWRTLSKEEWAYLYGGRENASKLRGFATVGSAAIGYVFLPDNWALPVNFKADGDPDDNKYTSEEWEALSNAGAVFLPAAGYTFADESAETDGVYKSGYYWTSDPYEGEVGDCYAFYFYYNDGYQSVNPENIAHGSNRYSVRLVKDVK
ncbi:MAG: hypothetical protein IJ776_10725 [Paludibacteraceae bacterium]|nr:hypothetical protein [Paludibacteraceae bacterium]